MNRVNLKGIAIPALSFLEACCDTTVNGITIEQNNNETIMYGDEYNSKSILEMRIKDRSETISIHFKGYAIEAIKDDIEIATINLISTGNAGIKKWKDLG